MSTSALETELKQKARELRHTMARHDRAVVIGFVLSFIPFLPITLAGIIIGVLNLLLWKKGRLELDEGMAIKIGLGVGVINALASIFFFVFFFDALAGLDWRSYFGLAGSLWERFSAVLRNLFGVGSRIGAMKIGVSL
jgi:hypothetical protein